MVNIVKVTPVTHTSRPPPKRRQSATGSINGLRGADLSVCKPEGWAWCSHMGSDFACSRVEGIRICPLLAHGVKELGFVHCLLKGWRVRKWAIYVFLVGYVSFTLHNNVTCSLRARQRKRQCTSTSRCRFLSKLCLRWLTNVGNTCRSVSQNWRTVWRTQLAANATHDSLPTSGERRFKSRKL